MTQPTNEDFTDGHYDNAALIGQHYVALGVAPVWLEYWDGGDASGFVAHEDTKQGRESGKTDPGPKFDRVRFISSLEDEMLNAEDKEWIAGMMRGVVWAIGTGEMSTGLKLGDPEWTPPKDLLDVLNAITDIPVATVGPGLTEEEAKEAAKQAAREGTG